MDGDAAGRAAAWRACERALPFAAPGRSLRVALLPDGADPDSLVRAAGPAAIEAAIAAASPLADFLWETLARDIAA
jgi:DNA primase